MLIHRPMYRPGDSTQEAAKLNDWTKVSPTLNGVVDVNCKTNWTDLQLFWQVPQFTYMPMSCVYCCLARVLLYILTSLIKITYNNNPKQNAFNRKKKKSSTGNTPNICNKEILKYIYIDVKDEARDRTEYNKFKRKYISKWFNNIKTQIFIKNWISESMCAPFVSGQNRNKAFHGRKINKQ